MIYMYERSKIYLHRASFFPTSQQVAVLRNQRAHLLERNKEIDDYNATLKAELDEEVGT